MSIKTPSLLEDAVKKLLIADEVDILRLPFILETVRIYLNNQSTLLQIKKNVSTDINASSVPSIFNTVLQCLIMFSKSINISESDFKYILYGLIYHTVVTANPEFFKCEIDLPSFQQCYGDIYDTFLMVPTIIKQKIKTGCIC